MFSPPLITHRGGTWSSLAETVPLRHPARHGDKNLGIRGVQNQHCRNLAWALLLLMLIATISSATIISNVVDLRFSGAYSMRSTLTLIFLMEHLGNRGLVSTSRNRICGGALSSPGI